MALKHPITQRTRFCAFLGDGMRDEHGHLQTQVYTAISWREALDAIEALIGLGNATDFCKRDEERLREASDQLKRLRSSQAERCEQTHSKVGRCELPKYAESGKLYHRGPHEAKGVQWGGL